MTWLSGMKKYALTISTYVLTGCWLKSLWSIQVPLFGPDKGDVRPLSPLVL